MRKNVLSVLICVISFCTGVYSQTSCVCYSVYADSLYPRVPMTQGTDIGHPPYYHCNNCSSQAIILPFNFCFYGKNYDTVFVNNKGNLTFNNPEFHFSRKEFPFGNDTLMLAPFYSAVDDSPKVVLQHILADISYTLTATHLIVQWSLVGYNVPDCDVFNSFQITITNGNDTILPAGNNVSYCYSLMKWASGDSGTLGFNGHASKIGVNKGDNVHYAQFGAFSLHGYNYVGPYDTNGQLYWLDGKSFVFNTCVNGNNIPPVIVKKDSCFSDTVCAGDTLKLNAAFLCSELGQKATISVSSPGISGFMNDTLSKYSIYYFKTALVPLLKDTGTRTITITATDNGSPALKDSLQFKVFIKNCHLSMGVNNPEKDNSQFTLYPNPNNGKFTITPGHAELVSASQTIVEVYNIFGQKVTIGMLKQVQHDYQVNMGAQPSGVYFYRILDSSGGLLGNGKFVIQ